MTDPTSRYNAGSTDLIAKIADLKRRISRLEFNPRISSSSIDSGSLRVKIENGLLVLNEDGDVIIEVEQVSSTLTPIIRFAPPGPSPDTRFNVSAADSDFGIEGFLTNVQYSITDAIASEQYGFVASWNSGTILGRRDPGFISSAIETRNLTPYSGNNDSIRIMGRFLDDVQATANEAIYTGTQTTGAVSSITITYPITFATTIAPMVAAVNASAISFNLTAQSTSSFTIAWTGGAVAKTLNYWNPRL